jgi:hypothetical protein
MHSQRGASCEDWKSALKGHFSRGKYIFRIPWLVNNFYKVTRYFFIKYSTYIANLSIIFKFIFYKKISIFVKMSKQKKSGRVLYIFNSVSLLMFFSTIFQHH